MTGLLLALAVERLDHREPVFHVDAEQGQQHEPEAAPLVGGARLGLAPEVVVDAGQSVFAHNCTAILPRKTGLCGSAITSRSHRPHIDHLDGLAA